MTQHREGHLSGDKLKIGIVVARFNSMITDRLLSGAVDCLVRHGTAEADITVSRVPGSWEIPLALRWMADSGAFDALISIGCVIRGGTPHFEYVASEVTKGAAQVQLSSGVPVALGVLTTDTIEQAIERSGTKHGNKGADAAIAAIEMANLKKRLEG